MNIYLVIALAAVISTGITIYNILIRARNLVAQSKADVDALLKRRFNLIPNLIETVKGYAKHEKETFEAVTKARGDAMNAVSEGDPSKVQASENVLSEALKSVFALAENYPDLKASVNFKDLQDDLTDTEDKIVAGRRFFNNSLQTYTTKTQMFPNNIIARIFGFKVTHQYMAVSEGEAAPVQVKF